MVFFSFFSLISLIADGPHHHHPACGHNGSSHLSLVHALQFFIAMQVQHSSTRQPMVEFYLITFPRFSLRKKEHKSYFGKNRTHDFRTSRRAGYILDHSGDEGIKTIYIVFSLIFFRQVGSPRYLPRNPSCSVVQTLALRGIYYNIHRGKLWFAPEL